jgi:serine/threonine-protein kinase
MSGSDAEEEDLVGETIADKYRIEGLLGRGGMGAVYRATNLRISKRVALKFLERDAARDLDAVTRFQREAEAASAVESAHIVEIFDSGRTDDGRPYLVMEMLSGEDLRTRLRREERLPLPETVHMTGQVLRALSRAHAAGIVHRDLKPDNIFLCRRDDDPMFVKIVDFGISKVAPKTNTVDTLTRRGTVLGTALYMSPEQAQAFRDIDGRSDLFGLGAIVYECLAGRPPHTGSAYEAILIDICTKDAADVRTHNPDVPEAVAEVLKKALARERDQRFQTATEFYDALALAAPGLLRTGGPTGARGSLGSLVDAATPSPRVGGPVATAEGTAVRLRADAKTQTRRVVIAALVAALAAFVISLFVRPGPSDSAGAEGASAARSAMPITAESDRAGAPASAEPVVEPEPSASAPASASAAPSAKKPPVAGTRVKPVGKNPGPKPTAKATTTAKPPHTGVASGLTLDVDGP